MKFMLGAIAALAVAFAPGVSASEPAPVPSPAPNPNSIIQGDSCHSATSLGFANLGISLAFGFGLVDKNCVRLKDSRALADLGFQAAAAQLLCDDPKVAAAMQRAGTPCSAQINKESPHNAPVH